MTNYQHNAANRLLENSSYTYAYDNNGNLTGQTEKATSEHTSYAYTTENQLKQVTLPGSGGIVTFKYDPLGRRIEKATPAGTFRYVYDNEDIIAVLDSNNTLTQNITHGPGIDEPLILKSSTSANYYYHADGLGSIVSLSNDSAETVETYEYQAYGQPTIKDHTGAVFDKSTVGNPYLFTGREYDNILALYYFRARHNNPVIGRFIQEDPIMFSDGGNTDLYSYARRNPITYIDPFGDIVMIFDPATNTLAVYSNEGFFYHEYEARGHAGGKGPWPPGVYRIGRPRGPRNKGTRKEDERTGRWFIPAIDQPIGRSDMGIHGGGSCASNPYSPTQEWCSTMGCIRIQNRDLEGLVRFIQNDIAHKVPNVLVVLPQPTDNWPAWKKPPEMRRMGF